MSSYRGPGESVSEEGESIAATHVAYDVRVHPRSGLRSWRGILTRIRPEHTLEPAQYRLRLPAGREGTILISNIRISSRLAERATFVGSGPDPQNP